IFSRLTRAKSFVNRLRSLGAFPLSDFQPRIGLLLGLTDPVCGLNMGETAEVLAREFALTREEQDAFALQSHQRALAAREKLAEEIFPAFRTSAVRTTHRSAKNGSASGSTISEDNGPRQNQ